MYAYLTQHHNSSLTVLVPMPMFSAAVPEHEVLVSFYAVSLHLMNALMESTMINMKTIGTKLPYFYVITH